MQVSIFWNAHKHDSRLLIQHSLNDRMAKSKHKSKKHGNRDGSALQDKELYVKDEGTCYGFVEKCYGNGRFEIVCDDAMKHRMGILRGSMRNRVWIGAGDMVLCCLRDFEDSKVDIVHRYSSDDVKRLYKQNSMPQDIFDLYTSGSTEARADEDIVAFMDGDVEDIIEGI
jgi:translation initiation factor 1A